MLRLQMRLLIDICFKLSKAFGRTIIALYLILLSSQGSCSFKWLKHRLIASFANHITLLLWSFLQTRTHFLWSSILPPEAISCLQFGPGQAFFSVCLIHQLVSSQADSVQLTLICFLLSHNTVDISSFILIPDVVDVSLNLPLYHISIFVNLLWW